MHVAYDSSGYVSLVQAVFAVFVRFEAGLPGAGSDLV